MKKIKEFFKKYENEFKVGAIIGVTTVISYAIGQGKGYGKAIDSFNTLDITFYTNDGIEKKLIETPNIKSGEE